MCHRSKVVEQSIAHMWTFIFIEEKDKCAMVKCTLSIMLLIQLLKHLHRQHSNTKLAKNSSQSLILNRHWRQWWVCLCFTVALKSVWASTQVNSVHLKLGFSLIQGTHPSGFFSHRPRDLSWYVGLEPQVYIVNW